MGLVYAEIELTSSMIWFCIVAVFCTKTELNE